MWKLHYDSICGVISRSVSMFSYEYVLLLFFFSSLSLFRRQTGIQSMAHKAAQIFWRQHISFSFFNDNFSLVFLVVLFKLLVDSQFLSEINFTTLSFSPSFSFCNLYVSHLAICQKVFPVFDNLLPFFRAPTNNHQYIFLPCLLLSLYSRIA